MVGEACLPSNAYYPRTPDYTLCSGVHVCWSEHSDSSFVYGFMILDYGFGTMTATTFANTICRGTHISKCFREHVGRLDNESTVFETLTKWDRMTYSSIPISPPSSKFLA